MHRAIEHCTLQFRSSCDLFPKEGKMTLAELEPRGLDGFTPPTRGAWWVGGGWLVAAEGRRILQQVCQRSRNRCAWLGGAGTAGWCCTVCGKILYNAMCLEDAPLANVEFAPYQCFNPIGNLYTLYLLSVGLTHLQLCSCSLNQVLSGIR